MYRLYDLLLPYSEQPQMQPHTMYSFNQTKPIQIKSTTENEFKKIKIFYLFICFVVTQTFFLNEINESSYTKTVALLIDNTVEPFSFLFQLSYWFLWQN